MNDPFEPDTTAATSSVEFLAASRHRIDVLRALREDGPSTRRDVRDSVDASRSTVRRTLEGFLERDWIAPTDDGYRVTASGGLVAEQFQRLLRTVRVADEYAPLLRHLPAGALDVDPTWLEPGTLTTATEADPYAPARRQTETVRNASRFEALLPSIEMEGAELVHQRIVEGEMEAVVVLSAAAAETVRSEPFADLFREKLATGRLEVYAHGGDVPMYLGLPDDEAVEIGAENAEGIPRALLQSRDEQLREWGEARFEEYVEESEKLSIGDF